MVVVIFSIAHPQERNYNISFPISVIPLHNEMPFSHEMVIRYHFSRKEGQKIGKIAFLTFSNPVKYYVYEIKTNFSLKSFANKYNDH